MRRKGIGFWLLWVVALMGISGCALSQAQKKGILLGAATGAAIGAGVGVAVGNTWADEGSDERLVGTGIGAAAGALIGGLTGYMLAKEPPPPTPPSPPVPTPPSPPVPTPPPPAPKKIILRGVNFDFDKSDIKAEFAPVLDEAVRILKENPEVRVRIEGHTDSTGSEDYNQGLSERRSQAVTDFLVSGGIESSRLQTAGYGESQPMADNSTREGRAMNRRAEIKVIK